MRNQAKMTSNSNAETPTIGVFEAKQDRIKRYIVISITTFFVVFLLNLFLVQIYTVRGSSMSPTLRSGDRVAVWKLPKTILGGSYFPQHGDVVVVKSGIARDGFIIKRVIGLPGERVTVRDSRFEVYDDVVGKQVLYVSKGAYANLPVEEYIDTFLKGDQLFVVGDNRSPYSSIDSRSISVGPVYNADVVGVAKCRIWPLAKFDCDLEPQE